MYSNDTIGKNCYLRSLQILLYNDDQMKNSDHFWFIIITL